MSRKKKNISAEEAQLKRLETLTARKRKALEELAEVQAMEAEVNGEEAAPEEGLEALPENPRIAAILEDIANAGTFCVYKLDKGTAAKVGQYPITDWPDSMEKTAREAGGGTFRVQFRRADGTQAGQITQTYDPKFYRPENSGGPLQMDSALQVMLESIKESKRDMMDMMKLVLGRNDNSMIKTTQDLAALLPILKVGDKGGSVENMMELFTTALELGKSIGTETAGAGSGDSITGKIVTTLLNALGKPVADQLAKSLIVGPTARPGAVPKPLPDVPAPAPNKEVTQMETTDPAVLKVRNNFFFRLYAPGLLEAARTNSDPAEYAEQILDRVPESWSGVLLDVVSHAEVVDYLAIFEPRVKQFPEWFKELARIVRNNFEVDEIEEAPEPPADGNGKEPSPVLAEV